MKFEVFEKIINDLKSCTEKDREIYKLGIDITNVIDDYTKIISLLIKSYYSEEGADWIDWFLYEKTDENKAYDKVGNEICKDLKELWIIVEEIRCSMDFKEYELKPEMTDEEREKLLTKLFSK